MRRQTPLSPRFGGGAKPLSEGGKPPQNPRKPPPERGTHPSGGGEGLPRATGGRRAPTPARTSTAPSSLLRRPMIGGRRRCGAPFQRSPAINASDCARILGYGLKVCTCLHGKCRPSEEHNEYLTCEYRNLCRPVQTYVCGLHKWPQLCDALVHGSWS